MLKKIIANPFFLYPVLTCIFFWPLSLQIFTFKNDALTYYYPIRTLISDALNNHELPLWTPFINMGYPLHADLQSGAWNPVIWAFAYLTQYSLTGFHFEVLFYLALGGIGFFYLGRSYGFNRLTAFIIGLAFELSGPIIDSIQFTASISSACYVPFVFLFFRRMLRLTQPMVNALLTGLFLYLLFTGGYPAMFIITIYLLLALLLLDFFSAQDKMKSARKWIGPLVIAAVSFILLSLPAILSFARHLQFIDRGHQQGLDFILENSMPPTCMFSLLSPFSTTATSSFFNTNILMRSTYIGLVPLIFLIYTVCNNALRKSREIKFLLITALLLFAMAWGEHFFLRQLAYYTLPLMNTFRHPALFRFFGVVFLLIAAGRGMNEWMNKTNSNSLLQKIIAAIGALTILIAITVIVAPGIPLLPAGFDSTQLKQLLPTLSFGQRYLIQWPFIIATIATLYYTIRKRKSYLFIVAIAIADLFFATQLNMPVTVIGASSFSKTESFINRNPIKFPLPANTTIEQNTLHSVDSTNTVGSILPFEKKIGRNDYFITPGNLSLQDQFYESAIRDAVFKNPVLYFADTVLPAINNNNISVPPTTSFALIPASVSVDQGMPFNTDSVSVKKISANELECSSESNTARVLVLLQNNYPGWQAFVDGNNTDVFTANTTFIAVNVPAGKHQVLFRYRPTLVVYAWYISLFTLLGMAICLLWLSRRRYFLRNH